MWDHHRKWYIHRYLCPEVLAELHRIRENIRKGVKYYRPKHWVWIDTKLHGIPRKLQTVEEAWLSLVTGLAMHSGDYVLLRPSTRDPDRVFAEYDIVLRWSKECAYLSGNPLGFPTSPEEFENVVDMCKNAS